MFWVFFKLAIDAQINKIDFTSYNHHIKKLIYICYITSIFKGPILYCKIYFFMLRHHSGWTLSKLNTLTKPYNGNQVN